MAPLFQELDASGWIVEGAHEAVSQPATRLDGVKSELWRSLDLLGPTERQDVRALMERAVGQAQRLPSGAPTRWKTMEEGVTYDAMSHCLHSRPFTASLLAAQEQTSCHGCLPFRSPEGLPYELKPLPSFVGGFGRQDPRLSAHVALDRAMGHAWIPRKMLHQFSSLGGDEWRTAMRKVGLVWALTRAGWGQLATHFGESKGSTIAASPWSWLSEESISSRSLEWTRGAGPAGCNDLIR